MAIRGGGNFSQKLIGLISAAIESTAAKENMQAFTCTSSTTAMATVAAISFTLATAASTATATGTALSTRITEGRLAFQASDLGITVAIAEDVKGIAATLEHGSPSMGIGRALPNSRGG